MTALPGLAQDALHTHPYDNSGRQGVNTGVKWFNQTHKTTILAQL